MATYAQKTTVDSSKSLTDIQSTLRRYGAKQFGFLEGEDAATVMFVINGVQIRITVPLPSRDQRDFTHYQDQYGNWKPRTESAAETNYEQAVRQKWRALLLVIKAKLEAIESGISTLEQEFLAFIVMPGTGKTVGEQIGPQIQAAMEAGPGKPVRLSITGG